MCLSYFYWYYYCRKSRKKTYLYTDIGGVRISKIPESDLLLNTTPRTKTFIPEKPEKKVLKKIDEFKLTDNLNKGCCIFWIAWSGKSTLLCNKLQQELGEGKFTVCAPTHNGHWHGLSQVQVYPARTVTVTMTASELSLAAWHPTRTRTQMKMLR